MEDSTVVLKLAPNEYTKKMWDKDFECTFTTTLTAGSLDTELVVANTGKDAFDFQVLSMPFAMHLTTPKELER